MPVKVTAQTGPSFSDIWVPYTKVKSLLGSEYSNTKTLITTTKGNQRKALRRESHKMNTQNFNLNRDPVTYSILTGGTHKSELRNPTVFMTNLKP